MTFPAGDSGVLASGMKTTAAEHRLSEMAMGQNDLALVE